MDPNVKRLTWVVRKCMLFGLGFLAVGLLCLFLFLVDPPRADLATNLWIFTDVLVLLGAIFVCVRVGAVVDRQQRTITTWWGLLVPFYKTEHLFSQGHFVTLSREERTVRGQTYDVFPVRLEGAGTVAIAIHELQDHDNARQLSEDLAKFISLGIRDRSSGREVAREAGALDESLQQRLRRAVRPTPLPVRPPDARAIFKYGGTRAPTTIEIPPGGHSVRWFLIVILIAAFVTLFAELGMDKEDMEIGVRALLVFLFILGFFVPLLLRTAILRERLVVSPDEIVVTRRDIFGTKTTRLTSGEIEEVEVIQARSVMSGGYATFGGVTQRVVIRSDRGSIELGGALSTPAEVKWLSDVLVHVLTLASRDA